MTWSEMIQVHIPKPGQGRDVDRAQPASKLRPISLMSVWWCLHQRQNTPRHSPGSIGVSLRDKQGVGGRDCVPPSWNWGRAVLWVIGLVHWIFEKLLTMLLRAGPRLPSNGTDSLKAWLGLCVIFGVTRKDG